MMLRIMSFPIRVESAIAASTLSFRPIMGGRLRSSPAFFTRFFFPMLSCLLGMEFASTRLLRYSMYS